MIASVGGRSCRRRFTPSPLHVTAPNPADLNANPRHAGPYQVKPCAVSDMAYAYVRPRAYAAMGRKPGASVFAMTGREVFLRRSFFVAVFFVRVQIAEMKMLVSYMTLAPSHTTSRALAGLQLQRQGENCAEALLNTSFSYTQSSSSSRNHWYYTLPICHSS